MLQVPHVGLVNLIAEREVSPEFLQGAVTPRALADAALPLLDPTSPAARRQREGLALVRERLGPPARRELGAAVAAEAAGGSGSGGAAAAEHAGALVIAAGARAASAWGIESWDRFCLPKPFARVDVAYSPAFTVAAGKEGLREAMAQAAQALADVTYGGSTVPQPERP